MSHTAMVLLGGFVLMAAMIGLGRPTRAQAARRFIPLWAILSLANMLVGVLQAGYGWTEEAGVLVIVFGVPAIVAFGLSRLLKS